MFKLIGEKVVMLTIYYLKLMFANLFTNPYNNVLINFPGFTKVRKFYVIPIDYQLG